MAHLRWLARGFRRRAGKIPTTRVQKEFSSGRSILQRKEECYISLDIAVDCTSPAISVQ